MSGQWRNSNRRQRLPPNWQRTIVPRILARDPTCKLHYRGCTHTATQVDHRQPGDDHRDTNLQGVCAHCHALKSSREGVAAQPTRRRPPEPHPGLTH